MTLSDDTLRRYLSMTPADRAAFDRSRVGAGVTRVRDELLRKVEAFDAMLAGQPGGYPSLRAAYADITGRSLYDVTPEAILRESVGFDSSLRSVESVQASTFNYILGDSVTRRMVAEYRTAALDAWRLIVNVVPVNDFRTQRVDRLGGYGLLPAVNESAPYQPLTSPGNEEATYAITKRGGTEDLTLEAIADDDVRLVQRIPVRLGRSAARTLFNFVFDMLNTNPTYTPDGTSVFTVGHGNTATSALGRSAIDQARKAMRSQTAYGDSADILGVTPKILVVANSLEDIAFEICKSAMALPTTAPDGGASNLPNLHQGMNYVVVDYWSSTTAWYALADPKDIPSIEVGFYRGQQDPELFVQNDPTVGAAFSSDKITFKIRHIYSGTVVDYRGLYRGNV